MTNVDGCGDIAMPGDSTLGSETCGLVDASVFVCTLGSVPGGGVIVGTTLGSDTVLVEVDGCPDGSAGR